MDETAQEINSIAPESTDIFDIEDAKKQHEIDERTWDESGAKRELFLHKRIGEIVRESVEEDSKWKIVEVKPEAADVTAITITMDLALINSEVGHEKTNEIIKDTIGNVREMIKQIPGAEAEIYRESGGDFTIIANLAKVIEKEIMHELENKKVDLGEGKGAIPLYVAKRDLYWTAEVFNMVVRDNFRHGIEASPDTLKAFISMWIEQINENREIAKLQGMALEFQDSFKTGQRSAQESLTYYNKYLSRTFEDSAIGSYNGLLEASEEDIKAICTEIAKERVYGISESTLTLVDAFTNKHVKQAIESAQEIGKEVKATPYSYDTPRDFPERAFPTEVIFENQKSSYRTEQRIWFDRIGYFLTELGKASQEDLYKGEGFATDMERDILMRGHYPEEIKQKVLESLDYLPMHPNTPQRWVHEHRIRRFLESAERDYELQQLRFDRLTGLPSKLEFNRTFREKRDSEFNVLLIDVAFLKYFNNVGGRATGDLALMKTAWLLEQTQNQMEELGIKVHAYRTGGDEFSILIDGPEENVKEYLTRVAALAAEKDEQVVQHGVVVAHPNAKSVYQPEQLQLNFGYCSNSQARKALEELDGNNLSAEEKPFKALEEQLKIADSALFYNKGLERFVFLTDRILELEKEGPEQEDGWKQFDALFAASGKALQGKSVEMLKVYAERVKELAGYPAEVDREELNKLFLEFIENETTIAP